MKLTMLAESRSSTQVDQEVDALRQKVKQLKDAVEEYKVKQYSIIQGLIQKFYEVGGCYIYPISIKVCWCMVCG